jgi:hypothetical protein
MNHVMRTPSRLDPQYCQVRLESAGHNFQVNQLLSLLQGNWIKLNLIECYAHTDPGSGDGAGEDNRDCSDKVVMPCDSEEFIMVSVLLVLTAYKFWR